MNSRYALAQLNAVFWRPDAPCIRPAMRER